MDERKFKYKKKFESTGGKYVFTLDLETLNIMCSFVVSENSNIKKSHLFQLQKLFNQIDIDRSYTDQDRLNRVKFIMKGLEAKLQHGYTDQTIVIKYINGGLISYPLFPLEELRELNNNEVNWVNVMVSQSLKTSFIENETDDLYNILTEFKSSNQFEKPNLLPKIEAAIKDIQSKFRSSRVEDPKEEFFSLRDDIFTDKITETYNALMSPSNKLCSGMQGLNEMLGGGFEKGRLYLFLGLPGEGKSTTMLNIAYQIKKYNKKYILRDKTKTPCIVFLTMENSLKETIERLFNISTRPESLIDYSLEEVMDLMRTEGQLFLSDTSPIDIVIKYTPSDLNDTNYLYTLYDELEDQGYECICMIQDYLKRIRSANNHSVELRLELGYICNEFKTFGEEKQIPVISASQLNRDAARHIDESRKKNDSDLVRLFGRNNIGESINILENADAVFFLAPELDHDGNNYLGMQLAKKRFKGGSRSHCYQPYVPGNPIKLLEDENLATPMCKDTLNPNVERARQFMENGAVSGNGFNQINTISAGNTKLLASSDNIYTDDSNGNFFELNYIPNYVPSKKLKTLYRKLK